MKNKLKTKRMYMYIFKAEVFDRKVSQGTQNMCLSKR